MSKDFDITRATADDVPFLLAAIRKLREVTKETGTKTHRAQAIIFRSLPPVILAQLMVELERPEPKIRGGLGDVLAGKTETVQ